MNVSERLKIQRHEVPALDATQSPDMTDRNRLEARAALAEALDVLEGGAA